VKIKNIDTEKCKKYKLKQDEEENEMNGWIDDETLQYMQEQTQKEDDAE
jgi:hypothetical protein